MLNDGSMYGGIMGCKGYLKPPGDCFIIIPCAVTACLDIGDVKMNEIGSWP